MAIKPGELAEIGGVDKRILPDPASHASTLFNLGCAYQQLGDLEKAEQYLLKAISAYNILKNPLNLSVAYISLCDVYIEIEKWKAAVQCCELAKQFAEVSQRLRGLADVDLFYAHIAIRMEGIERAEAYWNRAMKQFETLGIDEGRNYYVGALIERKKENWINAQAHLEKGLQISQNVPISRAQLAEEYAKLHRAMGNAAKAQQWWEAAQAIYQEVEAKLRINSTGSKT